MEIILSTAFGVKAETQTDENDPITQMARKATTPHPIIGVLCKIRLPFNLLALRKAFNTLKKCSLA